MVAPQQLGQPLSEFAKWPRDTTTQFVFTKQWHFLFPDWMKQHTHDFFAEISKVVLVVEFFSVNSPSANSCYAMFRVIGLIRFDSDSGEGVAIPEEMSRP